MAAGTFDAFRAELTVLKTILEGLQKKTVRDEALRQRFRRLFSTWSAIVRPALAPLLDNKRDFFKLSAELELLARLTSKIKPVHDYRKRLNRALYLANSLVIFLPPSSLVEAPVTRASDRGELFLGSVPDLPMRLVPNPLIGWKREMEAFVNKYPFDKSVFIMIKYRRNNRPVIRALKSVLSQHGFSPILASEHNLTDDLYNPIACLLCCSKGIAVFDKPEPQQPFNPNVAYELGMMHLLGRNCLILKHTSLTALHTDILMKIYVEYRNLPQARTRAADWINNL
jgi:hypothetical protein